MPILITDLSNNCRTARTGKTVYNIEQLSYNNVGLHPCFKSIMWTEDWWMFLILYKWHLNMCVYTLCVGCVLFLPPSWIETGGILLYSDMHVVNSDSSNPCWSWFTSSIVVNRIHILITDSNFDTWTPGKLCLLETCKEIWNIPDFIVWWNLWLFQ